MHRTRFGDMVCSIARTVEVVGETWSPLILRDVWAGVHRFDDIQADLGVSSKVLAERLKSLVAYGVLERRRYSERPPRHEYVLTPKGSELCAVLMAMSTWGDRHAADEHGRPTILRHHDCGQVMTAEVRCDRCGGVVSGLDVDVEPGPAQIAAIASRR